MFHVKQTLVYLYLSVNNSYWAAMSRRGSGAKIKFYNKF